MDHLVFQLINYLQLSGAELVSVLTLLFCFVAIFLSYKIWGLHGLYVYNAVAFIVGNIQVLKLVTYSFSPEPAAMGTVVFCTTFLVSDIITEHFGPKAARQGLWLSFFGQVLVSILMILALGHAPVEGQGGVPVSFGKDSHQAMMQLFAPSPRMLLASITAYMVSQLFDIWLFQKIRTWCSNRWVWLRQNVSVALSGLLDNFLFSWLAWIVLAPIPLTYETVFFTFIAWTYLIRLVVSVLGTPVLYLTYKI